MILALDQSTNITGWALFKNGKLFEHGYFDLGKLPKSGDENQTNKRSVFKDKLASLIDKNNVKMVITEGVYYQKNPESYKNLSKFQGRVQDFCKDNDLTCFSWANAGQWRKVIGVKGRKKVEYKQATKDYVIEKFDLSEDLTEDECDAIAIGSAYIVMTEEMG
jgi:Holliday junction resolvasome RuvABC endonuclease subunit